MQSSFWRSALSDSLIPTRWSAQFGPEWHSSVIFVLLIMDLWWLVLMCIGRWIKECIYSCFTMGMCLLFFCLKNEESEINLVTGKIWLSLVLEYSVPIIIQGKLQRLMEYYSIYAWHSNSIVKLMANLHSRWILVACILFIKNIQFTYAEFKKK